jgi:cysteine desulfurase
VPFLTTHFGNPSSSHTYGKVPGEAMAAARRDVAALLGCDPEEVTFTSGGTEAINWVLKGAVEARRRAHPGVQGHIITAVTEHVAVLETCKCVGLSLCVR